MEGAGGVLTHEAVVEAWAVNNVLNGVHPSEIYIHTRQFLSPIRPVWILI